MAGSQVLIPGGGITINSSGSSTYSGSIVGAGGSVAMTGSGTQVLAGTNTFSARHHGIGRHVESEQSVRPAKQPLDPGRRQRGVRPDRGRLRLHGRRLERRRQPGLAGQRNHPNPVALSVGGSGVSTHLFRRHERVRLAPAAAGGLMFTNANIYTDTTINDGTLTIGNGRAAGFRRRSILSMATPSAAQHRLARPPRRRLRPHFRLGQRNRRSTDPAAGLLNYNGRASPGNASLLLNRGGRRQQLRQRQLDLNGPAFRTELHRRTTAAASNPLPHLQSPRPWRPAGQPTNQPGDPTLELSGNLTLGGPLWVQNVANLGTGNPGNANTFNLSGGVTITRTPGSLRAIFRQLQCRLELGRQSNRESNANISGNIVDAAGPGSPQPLILYSNGAAAYYRGGDANLIISGTVNTYAGGTVIDNCGVNGFLGGYHPYTGAAVEVTAGWHAWVTATSACCPAAS